MGRALGVDTEKHGCYTDKSEGRRLCADPDKGSFDRRETTESTVKGDPYGP